MEERTQSNMTAAENQSVISDDHITSNNNTDTSTGHLTAGLRDHTPPDGSSDGDGEKTARERLKKTSIAGLAQQSKAVPTTTSVSDSVTGASVQPSNSDSPLKQSTSIDGDTTITSTAASGSTANGSRGRPAKKRSFEDLTKDEIADMGTETAVAEPPLPKSGHHKRMRSRDVSSGEHVGGYGKYENDSPSPVHEESDVEAHKTPGGPGILVDVPKDEAGAYGVTGTATQPRSGSIQPSITSTAPKIDPTSGFANTSSASPFGSKAATKTEDLKPATSSAFASSGLSAFASSEKSPFGAVGGKSPGGFGSAGSSSGFGSSGSGFAGSSALGSTISSGFGGGSSGAFGTSSGFGGVKTALSPSGGFGGGFGAPKPFASGTSSFGGTSGTAGGFGTGKPFGSATKDEQEEGSGDEDEEHEGGDDKEEERDTRFQEQQVDTGEQEEDTVFACRAKLYHFDKEWKERGVGTFKINVRLEQVKLNESSKSGGDDENDSEDIEAGFTHMQRKGRLIMRTDGVHRVILNTPVFKGMHIGASDGSEPTGKTMHLQGMENGKPRGFQIKIGKEEVLKELYTHVTQLRDEL